MDDGHHYPGATDEDPPDYSNLIGKVRREARDLLTVQPREDTRCEMIGCEAHGVPVTAYDLVRTRLCNQHANQFMIYMGARPEHRSLRLAEAELEWTKRNGEIGFLADHIDIVLEIKSDITDLIICFLNGEK